LKDADPKPGGATSAPRGREEASGALPHRPARRHHDNPPSAWRDGLREDLGPGDLAGATLAELLVYGLGDGDPGGARSIMRAALDDLRNLSQLAKCTLHYPATDLIRLDQLALSLSRIVRSLEVALELEERAASPAEVPHV
jgi:hypothetical protein